MTAPRIEIARPRTFKTEAEERAWHDQREQAQEASDRAWGKFPPGTRMHVSSARGITRRTRAGVAFNAKASTEVLVVEGTDAEIAARVSHGEAVVSPLGAESIVNDDGLIVHGGPRSAAAQVAADDELAKAKAELAAARAELAKVRSSSSPKNDGGPTRLPRGGKAEGKAEGDDFGTDDKDKPKG